MRARGLGITHLAKRSPQCQPEAGAAALARTLQLDPGHADAALDLGMLRAAAGDGDTAVALAGRVLARQPAHGRALLLLGLGRRQQGDATGALPPLREAVAQMPKNADAHANLAACLESTNANAAAERAARAALALAPAHPLATVTLAQLLLARKDHAGAAPLLDRVLAGPAPAALRGAAHCARGKLRDRTGDAAGAFADFSAGQALLARQPAARAVDAAHFPALLRRSAAWLAGRQPRRFSPVSDRAPAFLVGFPRSGTTLALQLLGAHPALRPIDEREVLADTARALTRLRPGGLAYPAGIDALTDDERRQLARHYLDGARRILGQDADDGVIFDKMPLNLVHLPLVQALFPESRVVLALRDPRDCVLSAFMQSFEPTVAMVHCAALDTTAALYRDVLSLWQPAALPGLAWTTLRYEDVVDDVEAAVRPVLGFLGLDWRPEVLDWQARARGRHINTPSHQDVQKPIFRRARGRWRRYAGPLAAVQPVLAPFVAAFSYPAD